VCNQKCLHFRCEQQRAETWLAKQGATFGSQTGSHFKVLYQGRQSILPMHGKKELPKGLVADIKRQLGLKDKE
jgi:mRNA interferase HicA